MIRPAPLLLALLLSTSACFGGGSDDSDSDGGGGGPALQAGLYRVLQHTVSSESCSVEGTTVDWSPYFRIIEDGGGYDYEECDTTDAASCFPGLRSFLDRTAEGWSHEHANTQEGAGCDCCLNHTENLALPQADGSLRLEFRDWWTDLGPGATCTYEAALAFRSDDGCRSFEVLVGEPESAAAP